MKHLRRLNPNGDVETLAQIPDSIRSIDAAGDVVYLADPDNGLLYQWPGLEVYASRLDGIQGMHVQGELLYAEGGELGFYIMRFFDRALTPLLSSTAQTAMNGTKFVGEAQHRRINGLHRHGKDVYFAFPERHRLYRINSGSVRSIAGNGKQGFSIGANGNFSMAYPSDIAIIQNRVFVSDTLNHVMRELTFDMNQVRLIGHPLESGQVDEIGGRARLCNPTDLSVDNNQLLFLDDYDSIRSLDLNSLIVNTLHRSQQRITGIAVGPLKSVFFIETPK